MKYIRFSSIGNWILGIFFGLLVWTPAIGFSFIADWPGHWIPGVLLGIFAFALDMILIGSARGEI